MFVAFLVCLFVCAAVADVCKLLTVVIVTSPPASAPNISLFTSTYNYLREMPCASQARFMIGLHINPNRHEERFAQYEKNIVEWRAQHKNDAVFVLARMNSVEVSFSRLLSLVETKYYLFWEHDWRFCRTIQLETVLHQMELHGPAINYVRFNLKKTVVNTNGLYDAVLVPCQKCMIPLLFTPSWSNNPHIARTSFFTEHCRTILQKDPDAAFQMGFLEWPLTQAISATMHREGVQNATDKWGTYIYGSLNDAQMIYHLDGANALDTANIDAFAKHCVLG